MTSTNTVIDPYTCPLCKQQNECLNLSTADVDKACWCNDPTIKFPAELLQKVAEEAQGKACICKACALAYQAKENV
ncbi:cysteine-rich CWC family protein [Colwelliaceae bacterium 6471]